MNLKPVQINLGVEDVQTVLTISLDEDKNAALNFIRHRLMKKVEKSLQKR
ncbi:MAG: hypothetical protein ABR534_04560 [Desulfotignum sp.]|nr:hypothetical protein [Desulfobacteraceae bacterium]